MNYRKLGSTPLQVSEIALGTMQFQWIISEQEAFTLLDHYVSAGGNLIDTSDMYTQWGQGLQGGEAETILGKWFKSRKNRDKIILISKVRCRMWEGADGEGLSKKHIVRACEESLKRLQTDYIDIYMSHWPDTETPIEETTATYHALTQHGKIRFFGCSNYSGKELQEALAVGEKLGSRYVCVEPYYNLLHRNPFESDTLPLVQKYNLAVTPYSPLAGGFLSGVYKKNEPLPENARSAFMKNNLTEKNFALLDILEVIGRKYNKTIAQISLAWLLHHSWMTAPIIGPETIAQLEENISALNFTLHEDDFKKIINFTA